MKESNKVIEAAMADLNSNPEWTRFIESYKEKYRKVLQLSFILYAIGIVITISPLLIKTFNDNFNINQHLSIFYIGGAIISLGIIFYILQGMVNLPRTFNKISLKMYSDAIMNAT